MTAVREELLAVYGELDRMHAWRGWHWWPDADPFEVIVGAILVQNTAWTNVERALSRLRQAGALTPAGMAVLGEEELRALIRPSGQYRQKERKLRAFLALTREEGGLERLLALAPAVLRERLLATWGIGPETADAIILYAARQPSWVIDTYTIRLFGRLGLGPDGTSAYGTWKAFFERSLALDDRRARRDLWARYHALIVMHCKHLCRKRSPDCQACSLSDRCPAAGDGR